MAEAASAAEALKRSLDTEVTDRLALEAVVTSACEGLGVSASGSSLRSRVEAFYSRARERMREALHAGVKKVVAVVSSHYVGIDLPAVCEGYVLPDDEVEAQEEVQRLEDTANAPRDALAAFFDAEVELPPSAHRGLRRQGNEALKLAFSLFVNGKGQWALYCVYIILSMNVYMIVPFKLFLNYLVVLFFLMPTRPRQRGVG